MTTEVIVRVLFREILGNIQPFLKLGERLVTAAEAWFCVRAAQDLTFQLVSVRQINAQRGVSVPRLAFIELNRLETGPEGAIQIPRLPTRSRQDCEDKTVPLSARQWNIQTPLAISGCVIQAPCFVIRACDVGIEIPHAIKVVRFGGASIHEPLDEGSC